MHFTVFERVDRNLNAKLSHFHFISFLNKFYCYHLLTVCVYVGGRVVT